MFVLCRDRLNKHIPNMWIERQVVWEIQTARNTTRVRKMYAPSVIFKLPFSLVVRQRPHDELRLIHSLLRLCVDSRWSSRWESLCCWPNPARYGQKSTLWLFRQTLAIVIWVTVSGNDLFFFFFFISMSSYIWMFQLCSTTVLQFFAVLSHDCSFLRFGCRT